MGRTKMVKNIGLKVDYNTFSERTREPDENDSWDRGNTESSHYITGMHIDNEYPDITACFPVNAGDNVYLIYAVYSTGDSFGSDKDSSIEFIDVFKDKNKANEAADKLTMCKDHGCKITREDGSKQEIYIPWNGYFESLSYINVEEFTVCNKVDYNYKGRIKCQS